MKKFNFFRFFTVLLILAFFSVDFVSGAGEKKTRKDRFKDKRVEFKEQFGTAKRMAGEKVQKVKPRFLKRKEKKSEGSGKPSTTKTIELEADIEKKDVEDVITPATSELLPFVRRPAGPKGRRLPTRRPHVPLDPSAPEVIRPKEIPTAPIRFKEAIETEAKERESKRIEDQIATAKLDVAETQNDLIKAQEEFASTELTLKLMNDREAAKETINAATTKMLVADGKVKTLKEDLSAAQKKVEEAEKTRRSFEGIEEVKEPEVKRPGFFKRKVTKKKVAAGVGFGGLSGLSGVVGAAGAGTMALGQTAGVPLTGLGAGTAIYSAVTNQGEEEPVASEITEEEELYYLPEEPEVETVEELVAEEPPEEVLEPVEMEVTAPVEEESIEELLEEE